MKLRMKVRQRVQSDESYSGNDRRVWKVLLESPGPCLAEPIATFSIDDLTYEEAEMFCVGDHVDVLVGSDVERYEAVKQDRDRLSSDLESERNKLSKWLHTMNPLASAKVIPSEVQWPRTPPAPGTEGAYGALPGVVVAKPERCQARRGDVQCDLESGHPMYHVSVVGGRLTILEQPHD